MILDGYWKKELKSIVRQLELWSGKLCTISHDYAEHSINRAMLYSAVIIRKIVEDEKDSKSYFDERHTTEKYLKTLFYKVPVSKYLHVDDEKVFINSKLILSDYDTKNAESIALPLDRMCNQLVHTYVWSIVYTSSHNQVYGVMMASDYYMKKEAYLLKIEDWIASIKFVLENTAV